MSLACGSSLWGRLELEIPGWIRSSTMTADPQCMHLLTTTVKSLCPGWADHRLWKGSPFLEPGAALQGHTGILFTALPAVWRLSLARLRPASAQADSSLGNRALLSGPVAGGYWTWVSHSSIPTSYCALSFPFHVILWGKRGGIAVTGRISFFPLFSSFLIFSLKQTLKKKKKSPKRLLSISPPPPSRPRRHQQCHLVANDELVPSFRVCQLFWETGMSQGRKWKIKHHHFFLRMLRTHT